MKNSFAMLLLVVLAPTALAQPAGDPWAEVPALPTSCYQDGDDFEGLAYAASDALDARAAQQLEVNQAIEQQYGEVNMDELQQRMITFMMEHPDQAQRYMEVIQQGGQQVQEQTPEMAERSAQFETELQDLKAAYDAELAQAMGPIEERQLALAVTLSKTCNEGLLAKAAALEAEKNRAYGGLCANWWKRGPLHDWFARFKQFKIEEAALWAEHAETTKLNYEVMGIAADEYRSTESIRGPIDYLRRATEVFRKREFAPVSEKPGSCEIRHG